ncbi:MAG: membrane protein [Candidatus Kapaibacterium sp.]|nr:MAG: membrane protein [Candidatus Kapabacteria bacterium]
MEFLSAAFDILVHLDRHIADLVSWGGDWTYLLLFLVVFAETGFVITPFLPGDSLLFAVGSLCALGVLQLEVVIGLLIVAAVAGDAVNYAIGGRFGHFILTHPRWQRWIRKEHMDKTHAFYERHGGKTIVLARFVPIVRTFAPFIAGLGQMTYRRFALFNIIGAIAWVVSFTLLGFAFGNVPIVKRNFTLVIAAIIVVSMLPALVELIRQRRAAINSRVSS